jgi:hypothetical protein
MNERIRELAEQACFDEIGKDYSLYFNLTKEKVEKFAEMIVQEMLMLLEQYYRDSFPEDIMDDFDRGYLSGLQTARKAVKEHFGVKE